MADFRAVIAFDTVDPDGDWDGLTHGDFPDLHLETRRRFHQGDQRRKVVDGGLRARKTVLIDDDVIPSRREWEGRSDASDRRTFPRETA